jgi:hypothetical protein
VDRRVRPRDFAVSDATAVSDIAISRGRDLLSSRLFGIAVVVGWSLERAIRAVRSAAVLVGPSGLGPWVDRVRREVLVRDGKGRKDRRTVLPSWDIGYSHR